MDDRLEGSYDDDVGAKDFRMGVTGLGLAIVIALVLAIIA